MPKYLVETPDGQKFEVSVPYKMEDGGVEHMPVPTLPQESASPMFNRAGQSAVTGLLTVPKMAQVVMSRGAALGADESELPVGMLQNKMAEAGLARPTGVPAEGVLARMAEFMGAGAVPVAGLFARGRQLQQAGAAGKGLLDRMALSAIQNPTATIGSEVLGAGGAAVGGQMGHTAAPDSPGVEIAGELAGGLLAPMAAYTPTAYVGRKALQAARSGHSAIRGEGANTRAAARIQEASGPGALKRLDEPTELPMTIGQRVQSPGMRGIEEALAKIDPEFGLTVSGKMDDAQRLAREIPLRGLEGDVSDINRRLIERRRAITRRRQQEEARLGEQAEGAQTALGDPDELTDLGAGTRQNLDEALKLRKQAEDAAWEQVDKTAPVKYDNAVKAYDEFVENLGKDVPKGEVIPPWLDQRIAAYKEDPARTVGDLTEFRSFILEGMREARAAGNFKKAGFLNKLQSALLKDVEGVPGTDAARQVSRELNETFRQGKVGQLLGYEATGEAAIAPEATLRSIFTGSREQVAANLDALERASPESLAGVENFLRTEFLNTVFEKGRPVPSAVKQFLGNPKYAQALNRFPALKQKLSQAGEAQRLFDEAVRKKEVVVKGLHDKNRSVLSLFLDADPGQELKGAITSQTPYKTMRKLYTRVQTDPRARQGLQAETIRYILKDAESNGILTSKGLRAAMQKHANAMDGVALPAENRSRLAAIVRDLERIETPVGEKAVLADAPHTFLSRALRVAGAWGSRQAGVGKGTLQAPQMAASTAEEKGLQWLRKADKAHDAVVAAVMDDKVYREMLQREIKKGGKPPGFKHTRAWLFGTLPTGEMADQDERAP